MLDHVPTKEEGLVSIVKLKGSLGCSDHRMVEFKSIGCQRGRAASLLQESRLVTLQRNAWQSDMG